MKRILEETYSKGSQGMRATQLISLHGFTVKLTIQSDSYAEQQHATAKVWSKRDLQWQLVYDVHYGEMKTTSRASGAPDFKADFDRLLKGAALVLGTEAI